MRFSHVAALATALATALTSGRADLIQVPLGHREAPQRRRLGNRSSSTTAAPLGQGYGTHFAFLWVGTPPQRVSVIVDTGSSMTAFPCTGCSGCGEHTDPYFQVSRSSSARELSCAGLKDCEADFASVRCLKNKCVIGQSYVEGSSWTAHQVTDLVMVGGNDLSSKEAAESTALRVEYTFGCQTSETGLFISQLADGIMGMMRRQTNYATQLKSQGRTSSAGFSLCFKSGGGVMTLGGTDSRLHLSEMQYALDMNKNHRGWYTVEVVAVHVGDRRVDVDDNVYNAGKGTIVDSGTTDTFLPSRCAEKFKLAWREVTGSSYSNKPQRLSKEEVLELPVIRLTMRGYEEGKDAVVEVSPKDYMQAQSASQYISRIYLTEGSGAVLGANFMHRHDVHFDTDNGRIGFARSECVYGRENG